jgi:DNA-nicking Smr family endonuclease
MPHSKKIISTASLKGPMTPDFKFDPEAVQIPIEDWIDLHTFSPKEIPSLLEEYLLECQKRGFTKVRIIHGKGKGVQRAIVHAFLEKSPRIESFETAPLEAGSWGATIAYLKKIAPGEIPGGIPGEIQ